LAYLFFCHGGDKIDEAQLLQMNHSNRTLLDPYVFAMAAHYGQSTPTASELRELLERTEARTRSRCGQLS